MHIEAKAAEPSGMARDEWLTHADSCEAERFLPPGVGAFSCSFGFLSRQVLRFLEITTKWRQKLPEVVVSSFH